MKTRKACKGIDHNYNPISLKGECVECGGLESNGGNMNTTYTPGPWKFEDEYIRDCSGEIIADVYTHPSATHGDEMEANARLIASAPCLLDSSEFALKNFEEVVLPLLNQHGVVSSVDGAVEKLRTAIARAKGVSHE